jgi:hypothetical protein
MKYKILSVLALLVLASGCTRSITVKYDQGIQLENNSLTNKTISVEKFEDQRAWIDSKDVKSQSFIAQQGTWKFGVEYDGNEYYPINSMLQDIFVRELNAAGSKAVSAAEEQDSEYTLSGQIMNFEFENETGFVTVTSRRHISIAVTLADKSGKPLFSNELYNELDRENEGMGVLHSTNVDKLMGNVLKKVLTSVLTRINSELVYQNFDEIKFFVNGVDVTDKITNQYVML